MHTLSIPSMLRSLYRFLRRSFYKHINVILKTLKTINPNTHTMFWSTVCYYLENVMSIKKLQRYLTQILYSPHIVLSALPVKHYWKFVKRYVVKRLILRVSFMRTQELKRRMISITSKRSSLVMLTLKVLYMIHIIN